MARASLFCFVLLLLSATVSAHDPPYNITIISTEKDCSKDVAVTVEPSPERLALEFIYDTTSSTIDSLASWNATSKHETQCFVCATFKWYELIIGELNSIDLDFNERLDAG